MKGQIKMGLLIFVVYVITLFVPSIVKAQAGKLPPFRIMQADGKVFKAEDLPMGKPIVVIYFSPDCDHCQVLVKELMKRGNEFKKASVVLITYLPVNKVAQFNKEYPLQQFLNMYVGTEGASFFVRNYYRVMDMPFAALHDKNGRLVQYYSRDIPWDQLMKKLSQLK